MSQESLDKFGRSDLHYAIIELDISSVRSFVSQGADVNLKDVNGWTPLHFAAQQNSAEIANLLLESGAEIDAANMQGNTPLSEAVFHSKGDGELIKLLRSKGADPYYTNEHGQTPVGLARLIGNFNVAQFFADLPN